VTQCNKVPEDNGFREKCFLGSEMIILDYWGPNITNQGNMYCQALPKQYRQICNETLVLRLKDIKKVNH
jgi:hypothetical protein